MLFLSLLNVFGKIIVAHIDGEESPYCAVISITTSLYTSSFTNSFTSSRKTLKNEKLPLPLPQPSLPLFPFFHIIYNTVLFKLLGCANYHMQSIRLSKLSDY